MGREIRYIYLFLHSFSLLFLVCTKILFFLLKSIVYCIYTARFTSKICTFSQHSLYFVLFSQ